MKKNVLKTRRAKHGTFASLIEKLRWPDDDAYGDVPVMEQLEARLLMSANPISEIWSQQQDGSIDNHATVAMPLTAGEAAPAAATNVATDVKAPTLTSLSVKSGSLHASPFEVAATLGDKDSASVEWQITLENKVTGETVVYTGDPLATPGTSTKKVVFAVIDPAEVGDGDYTLTLTATDPAGNATSLAVSVRFDSTPPAIESITSNQAVLETFKSTKFTVNASDNFAVTKYGFTINGETVSISTSGVATYTFREAGVYELVGTAYDKAGNVSSFSQTITVAECADVKAPTVRLLNNYFQSQDVQVKVEVSDSDSLVINWTATVVNDATGEARVIATGDRAVAYGTVVGTLSTAEYPDGSYTIMVEAIDKGGNRTLQTKTIILDTTAPTVSIEAETTRFETGKIALNVVVDDVNLKSTSLKINGKSATLNKNGRVVYDFAEPGTYTLEATAADSAGNVTTVVRVIEIAANTDFIPPEVTIHSPAPGTYLNGTVSLKATITDNTDGYIGWKVTVRRPDGTAVVAATGEGQEIDIASLSYVASKGEQIIEIEARDAAGNVTIATTTFTKDTVRPKFVETNFGEYTGKSWFSSPFELTATVTDVDSPDDLITWVVTADCWATDETFIVATGKGPNVNAVIDPSNFPSGQYRFTIKVSDAAGNGVSQSLDKSMDAVPPIITVQSVETGVSGFRVYYHTTDDIGVRGPRIECIGAPVAEIVGKIYSGGGFNHSTGLGSGGIMLYYPGVYTYKIICHDAAGNEAFDIFTVSWYPNL